MRIITIIVTGIIMLANVAARYPGNETLFETGIDYPAVPESNKSYHLFKIGRNRDDNVIMYDLNLDINGKLNKSCPLNIYWVKRTDNNRLKPLTWIQNKYAYGLKFLDSESSQANDGFDSALDFQFVSYIQEIYWIPGIYPF